MLSRELFHYRWCLGWFGRSGRWSDWWQPEADPPPIFGPRGGPAREGFSDLDCRDQSLIPTGENRSQIQYDSVLVAANKHRRADGAKPAR